MCSLYMNMLQHDFFFFFFFFFFFSAKLERVTGKISEFWLRSCGMTQNTKIEEVWSKVSTSGLDRL